MLAKIAELLLNVVDPFFVSSKDDSQAPVAAGLADSPSEEADPEDDDDAQGEVNMVTPRLFYSESDFWWRVIERIDSLEKMTASISKKSMFEDSTDSRKDPTHYLVPYNIQRHATNDLTNLCFMHMLLAPMHCALHTAKVKNNSFLIVESDQFFATLT